MDINIWFIYNIPMNSNSRFCMYRQTNNLITRYLDTCKVSDCIPGFIAEKAQYAFP